MIGDFIYNKCLQIIENVEIQRENLESKFKLNLLYKSNLCSKSIYLNRDFRFIENYSFYDNLQRLLNVYELNEINNLKSSFYESIKRAFLDKSPASWINRNNRNVVIPCEYRATCLVDNQIFICYNLHGDIFIRRRMFNRHFRIYIRITLDIYKLDFNKFVENLKDFRIISDIPIVSFDEN